MKMIDNPMIKKRVEAWDSIGKDLMSGAFSLEKEIMQSVRQNLWFTEKSIRSSLFSIAENYLNKEALNSWLQQYETAPTSDKIVGVVLAGNIPLVGFHDLLCITLTGHPARVKLSEKDQFLLPILIEEFFSRIGEKPSVFFVERLQEYDAVIATGSNNTSKYFEQYFSHVPNIIRKNRNGVALLTGKETEEELKSLGQDVFTYFGLGCRNVSKIWVPADYQFDALFESWEEYKEELFNHNKYKNNFDYYYSILLLNREDFLTNDFVLLRQHASNASPISVLHFERYNDINEVTKLLASQLDEIQVLVKSPTTETNDLKFFGFGQAQCPRLMDYADDVDTMQFLLNKV